MITIQSEEEEYYNAIHEIDVLAFGREDEAELVNKLRKSKNFIPGLSLVALKDGEIVGHILFSPVAIHTKKGILPALALAPMAVQPEFQNKGVGSDLVRQGLERCRNLGHRVVIVIGHPTHYPRFGFTSARAKGLEVPFPVPDEAFMVLELVYCLRNYFTENVIPDLIRNPVFSTGFPLPASAGTSLPLRKQGRE